MTEASTGTGSPSRTALPSGPVWRAGLLAALAATVVNVLAWVLVQQVLDAGLQIPAEPGSTTLNSLPIGAVHRRHRHHRPGRRRRPVAADPPGPVGHPPLGHPGGGLRGPVGPARLRDRRLHRPAARPGPVPPPGHRGRDRRGPPAAGPLDQLVELGRPGPRAGEGGPEEVDGGGVEAAQEAGPDQVVGGGEAGEQGGQAADVGRRGLGAGPWAPARPGPGRPPARGASCRCSRGSPGPRPGRRPGRPRRRARGGPGGRPAGRPGAASSASGRPGGRSGPRGRRWPPGRGRGRSRRPCRSSRRSRRTGRTGRRRRRAGSPSRPPRPGSGRAPGRSGTRGWPRPSRPGRRGRRARRRPWSCPCRAGPADARTARPARGHRGGRGRPAGRPRPARPGPPARPAGPGRGRCGGAGARPWPRTGPAAGDLEPGPAVEREGAGGQGGQRHPVAVELGQQAGQQPPPVPGPAVLGRGGQLEDLGRGQRPAQPPLGLAVEPEQAGDLAVGLDHPELPGPGPLHVVVDLGPDHQPEDHEPRHRLVLPASMPRYRAG